jgi:hypothetical protein
VDDYTTTEDGWDEWNAAYEQNPVETAAALARAYAHEAVAQNHVDPSLIATQAALQVEQLRQNAEATQRQEREAQDIDRSMAAEYGRSWADHSAYVGERLAGDEDLQKEWAAKPSTYDRLQLIDRIYNEVKDARDVGKKEWDETVRFARSQGRYWENPEVRNQFGFDK